MKQKCISNQRSATDNEKDSTLHILKKQRWKRDEKEEIKKEDNICFMLASMIYLGFSHSRVWIEHIKEFRIYFSRFPLFHETIFGSQHSKSNFDDNIKHD